MPVEKVRIQSFFENLLQSVEAEPDSFLGFSQAESPTLGAFLADLDPDMPLDWNGVSFQGLPALRSHVIAQAGLEGVCSPDDVLITAGAAEANYLALRQLLEPGDEIIVERPGWPQADVLAQSNGAVIREWYRDEASGWALSLDALEELMSPRTRMMFLTNPNNPTGQLLDAKMLAQISKEKKISLCGIKPEQTQADFSRQDLDGPDAILIAAALHFRPSLEKVRCPSDLHLTSNGDLTSHALVAVWHSCRWLTTRSVEEVLKLSPRPSRSPRPAR